MPVLPDVQLVLRPGVVDFSWGHPDQGLLPVERLSEATRLALAEKGAEALSYGAEQGPGSLLGQLAAWLGREEGAAPALEQMMITGGISQALDMLCTLLTRPGDTILVQSPVYHLALRIFRDHDLRLVPVAADDQGLDPAALAEAMSALQRAGLRPKFLYTVPVFSNPSGATLAPARAPELLEMARAGDFLILEDDVYHALWYDHPAPPALYTLEPGAPVIRLGSFSKVLGPGLRLGWLAAAPDIVRRCTSSGMLDSGGGVSHFPAHVVAAYMAQGWLDEHVWELRRAYAIRRNVLDVALRRYLPATCDWLRPTGGFFLWLHLPSGISADSLLPIAESAGVSYVPGTRFFAGGDGARYCRLAFTLFPLAEMEEGARRLGQVIAGAA